MGRLEEHYLKVRDYAERFDLDESTVYKKIKNGEIKAIHIGKTIRIPSSELERYLEPRAFLEEAGAPEDGEPMNLGDRVSVFEEAAGRAPAEYVDLWRSGEIEDTAESSKLAIEALALRAALEQGTLA